MTRFEIKQIAHNTVSKYRSILMVGALFLTVSGLAISIPSNNRTNDGEKLSTDKTNTDSQIESSVPTGFPLAIKKEPSSMYGWRVDPFTLHSKKHHGVDFSAPAGTLVLATGNGRVIQSGYDQANGHFIEIEHGPEKDKNIYRTKFAHLRLSYVRQDQEVIKGESIGEVGSTGRSTSPHLHYEISQNNQSINPLLVLNSESKSIVASNQTAKNQNTTLQRVPFITNSGVTYRMVEVVHLKY